MKTVLLNEDWLDTWGVDENGDENEDCRKKFVSAFKSHFGGQIGQDVEVDFSFELLHQDSYETEDDFEPFDSEDSETPNKWDIAYYKTCTAFENESIWETAGLADAE